MLDKLVDNPILFYSVFSILSVLFLVVVSLIIFKAKKFFERKKLKNTSEIILNNHYEEPSEVSLEEEINKLEEKAKKNETTLVVEEFETENNVQNNFIKGQPIQIEINSEHSLNDEKQGIEGILYRMQEDLTKRDEKQIFEFEQEQEETAIISYQELLRANGRHVPKKSSDSKFDLAEFFESMSEVPKHSYTLYDMDEAQDLSVITIDEINKNDNVIERDIGKELREFKDNINSFQSSNIEIDAIKEKKKFKMSEFISPIYGRMNTKLEYPTIPNLDEKEKSISELKDDEFLSALKAFRQNL